MPLGPAVSANLAPLAPLALPATARLPNPARVWHTSRGPVLLLPPSSSNPRVDNTPFRLSALKLAKDESIARVYEALRRKYWLIERQLQVIK